MDQVADRWLGLGLHILGQSVSHDLSFVHLARDMEFTHEYNISSSALCTFDQHGR